MIRARNDKNKNQGRETRARKERKGMDEIKVCLIGGGRAGMIHARNYKNKIEGAKIVACVDAVEAAAKSAAEELGVEKVYTDYHDILDDKEIDAVVVVAPTDLHEQIVIDCANAGKHIFCEKPMAMTVEECDAMIEACERNNVKLQIGFMRRYDASFREAKAMLDAGAIGELVQVHSNTRGPSKPRPWMYDIKKSNGILAEVNSHDIDAMDGGERHRERIRVGGEFPQSGGAGGIPGLLRQRSDERQAEKRRALRDRWRGVRAVRVRREDGADRDERQDRSRAEREGIRALHER